MSPLGLAGSNSMHLKPSVRLACTDDDWNNKVRHIVVKRLTDPHGQNRKQIYKPDSDLNQRLQAATIGVPREPLRTVREVAEELMADTPLELRSQELVDTAYKLASEDPRTKPRVVNYPNPEGLGVSRVPIKLLSSDPQQVVTMRRVQQTSEVVGCECHRWRTKTEAEAEREGLRWPPESPDDEAYFVSVPGDGEPFGATRYRYRKEQRQSKPKQGKPPIVWTVHILEGKEQIVCNPSKCPYATGIDGKGVPMPDGKSCKPETVCSFKLAEWGGGELAYIHAESWATAKRFNQAMAWLYQLVGGQIDGVTIDLCLDYTEPQRVPAGGKTRHPYWYLAQPWGMGDMEFQRAAIAERQHLLANTRLLAELGEQSRYMLAEASMDWRRNALLPEFKPNLKALPGPSCVITDGDDVAKLVERGMDEEQAKAILEANDGNMEQVEEALPEEEPKAPAPYDPNDIPVIEGDFSVAEPAPAPEPAPQPQQETQPTSEEDTQPNPFDFRPTGNNDIAQKLTELAGIEMAEAIYRTAMGEAGLQREGETGQQWARRKLAAYHQGARKWWQMEGRHIASQGDLGL